MSERTFREQMIEVVMKRRGCDRADAEVLMARVADRLAGYTHDEVAEMHPFPESPVAGGPGDTT